MKTESADPDPKKMDRIRNTSTQFVNDYTRTVHQLTGLTGQNMEVLNQPYSGQLAYIIRFM